MEGPLVPFSHHASGKGTLPEGITLFLLQVVKEIRPEMLVYEHGAQQPHADLVMQRLFGYLAQLSPHCRKPSHIPAYTPTPNFCTQLAGIKQSCGGAQKGDLNAAA